MKIYVCGDSFMSRDPDHPGEHFSELMSSKFDIVNLAQGGVGNIDICFQIKSAIDNRADYVIIGKTDSGRTEMLYPIGQAITGIISIEHFRAGPDQRFLSRTLSTLMGENQDITHNLTKEQQKAAQLYFKYMFDITLKWNIDFWAIGYWLMKLRENNIKYFVIPDFFCIYDYAVQYPHSPRLFHTDLATQQQAAELLTKEITP